MKSLYAILSILTFFTVNAQIPSIQNEGNQSTIVNWETNQSKAPGDSCGTYYNNYIGLNKTNIIRQEYMSNDAAGSYFNGRAQRFLAPQEIEVSGVEFYAYIDNSPITSVMVITMLNEYDVITDSVGAEIIRDTVFVTHSGNSSGTFPPLPNISVQSVFDSAITVNTDYIVSIYTPTENPLIIVANDPAENAGNGENLSFALYSYTGFPSFPPGWYNMADTYGVNGDYDFLIAPLVKYDLHESFDIINDTICPGITANGCVENYNQVPIFSSGQYNSNYATSNSSVRWLWGDGTFNTGLPQPLCHTYQNSGTYSLNLQDTMYRWDYNTDFCLVDVSQNIVALDSVMPDFTFIQSNVVVDFTSTASFADSVMWNFGDGTTGGNMTTISHDYDSIGVFDVWLHVYNECTEDSIMYQVTTDDVGITEVEDLVSVYPNPSNTNVTINNLPSNAILEVYNIVGAKVVTTQTVNSKTTLNVSDLSSGTYFIKINSGSGSFTKKIVVKH